MGHISIEQNDTGHYAIAIHNRFLLWRRVAGTSKMVYYTSNHSYNNAIHVLTIVELLHCSLKGRLAIVLVTAFPVETHTHCLSDYSESQSYHHIRQVDAFQYKSNPI